MAGALAGRKSDIVAGLDEVAILAEAERGLAFERNDVLLLEQMIVEGNGLPAGRQLLIGKADLASVLPRVREYPVAQCETLALAPFRPGHAIDGDRAFGFFLFGHVSFSYSSDRKF